MQKWIDTRGGSRRCFKESSNRKLPQNPGSLWSLVLAGGHGERLRAFTEEWFGAYRLKSLVKADRRIRAKGDAQIIQ